MMQHPREWQPVLPGHDRSTDVSVEILVHLDGPGNHSEVWLTIYDPVTDGLFVCKSFRGGPLREALPQALKAIQEGLLSAQDHLLPF
jgi:hypothetical protein